MTKDDARALLVEQGANIMRATEKGAGGIAVYLEAEGEFHRAKTLLDAASGAIGLLDADEQLQCLRESADLLGLSTDDETYKMFADKIKQARLTPAESALLAQRDNATQN